MQKQSSGNPFILDLQLFADGGDGTDGADGGTDGADGGADGADGNKDTKDGTKGSNAGKSEAEREAEVQKRIRKRPRSFPGFPRRSAVRRNWKPRSRSLSPRKRITSAMSLNWKW